MKCNCKHFWRGIKWHRGKSHELWVIARILMCSQPHDLGQAFTPHHHARHSCCIGMSCETGEPKHYHEGAEGEIAPYAHFQSSTLLTVSEGKTLINGCKHVRGFERLTNPKSWQRYRAAGIFLRCLWKYDVLQPLEIRLVLSLRCSTCVYNMRPYFYCSTPRYLHKRNENTSVHKDLYINVYDRFIHNSPQLAITQMSIRRRTDKQPMA